MCWQQSYANHAALGPTVSPLVLSFVSCVEKQFTEIFSLPNVNVNARIIRGKVLNHATFYLTSGNLISFL